MRDPVSNNRRRSGGRLCGGLVRKGTSLLIDFDDDDKKETKTYVTDKVAKTFLDWAKAKADYRIGVKPVWVIAKELGVKPSGLAETIKRQNWQSDLAERYHEALAKRKAEDLATVEIPLEVGERVSRESVKNIMGEEKPKNKRKKAGDLDLTMEDFILPVEDFILPVADFTLPAEESSAAKGTGLVPVATSQIPAPVTAAPASVPIPTGPVAHPVISDDDRIQAQAEAAIMVIREHRKDIKKLKTIASVLTDRVKAYMDGSPIMIKNAQGQIIEAPFMNQKDSLVGVLEGLTRIYHRLQSLERVAYAIDKEVKNDPISVIFSKDDETV